MCQDPQFGLAQRIPKDPTEGCLCCQQAVPKRQDQTGGFGALRRSRAQVHQLNDDLRHCHGSPGGRRESGGFDAALLRPVGGVWGASTHFSDFGVSQALADL
jgi:hypothetical protein